MRVPLIRVGCLLLLLIGSSASAVTIDWAFVGNPGNAADASGYGAVRNAYSIGAYEITNAQYAEFLGAVAETDTHGLYHTNMGDAAAPNHGGITRTGSSGTYEYSPIAGRENMPVNWVSFWDSVRFANWMSNGQPTGAQDETATESGAYTITQEGVAANSIMRDRDASIVLPTNDEWYKAAYYDPVGQRYKLIPFADGHQFAACESPPGTTTYSANCNDAVGDLTAARSYAGSPGPYGTYDQGGNVGEWNETIYLSSARAVRGGAFDADGFFLGARYGQGWTSPGYESEHTGFRLAMIREPVTRVVIDIKPRRDANPINPRSRSVIPVAILGSDTFDTADVDVTTLAFGPDGAPPERCGAPDVNGDAWLDLVCRYPAREAGIAFGDTSACVTGQLLDGTPFKGCDRIETTPSGSR